MKKIYQFIQWSWRAPISLIVILGALIAAPDYAEVERVIKEERAWRLGKV